MTTLTIENVAEAIDQLVVERGEAYVYPGGEGCFYSFEDGTPGCIVGAIVAKIDPAAFEKLVEYEAPIDDGNGGIRRVSPGSAQSALNYVGVDVDEDLGMALRSAQSAQDMGTPWGAVRQGFVADVRALRG
jgi:hypothetical protein